MKAKLLLLILLAPLFTSKAQLLIGNNLTPEQLVSTQFAGTTVFSNVTFNGSAVNAGLIRDQAAYFTTNFNPTNLGLSQGIILSTGRATVALGPNNDTDAFVPTFNPLQGDVDLALLTTETIQNKAVLEFDFVASGSTLSFDYVFASEEYPEFVNTQFNDAFGIFLSGPGITGPFLGNAKNIAILPGSGMPIAINNINNGLTNAGPCQNCNFYVNNGTGITPAINTGTQYDGFTTVLTASETLIPGQTYHIKFAIANVTDNAWDSAVFFKANSFITTQCQPSDQCIYTFILTDNGGDGFNGNAMTVYQNGTFVEQLYDSENSNASKLMFNVPLCHGYPFELYWETGGEVPEDIAVTIYNPFSQPIYEKSYGFGTPGTTLYTGTVDCMTELNAVSFEIANFNLVPNPTHDRFEVSISDVNQKLKTVTLFDYTGREVLTLKDFTSRNTIDVSNLPFGIYMVDIETHNHLKSTKKLIIE